MALLSASRSAEAALAGAGVVEAALVALAFAASYLGFALFALSQKPHHATVAACASRRTATRAAVTRRAAATRAVATRAVVPPATRQRCVALGALALAGSFAASLTAQGPSFGSIVWLLVLACTGVGVMFTLSYRPHWLSGLQRAVSGG